MISMYMYNPGYITYIHINSRHLDILGDDVCSLYAARSGAVSNRWTGLPD